METLENGEMLVTFRAKLNGNFQSVYEPVTVATKALADAAATGLQKKEITVTADETNGGETTRYKYHGVNGVLEPDFNKFADVHFDKDNGEIIIKDEGIDETKLAVAVRNKLNTVASGGGTPTTNAADLTAGTLNDARLSSNVALKNGVPTAGDDLNKLYNLFQALNTIVTGAGPDGDDFVNTIVEILAVFSAYPEGVDLVTALGDKINISAIVNTLTETTAGKVLDARQGKVLKDLIDALTTNLSAKANSADVYTAQTVATYAAALTAATGTQKKLITVTTDENSGSANTKYFYEGVNGVLDADFTKASSVQFEYINGEQSIKDSWLNSKFAAYLSANGYTPGGTPNTAPVASSVAFTGTPTEGQTLTGTYTYSDAESNAEGTSLKKWYRSDNTSGLNRAAISGATASTYVLQAGDVGKYIQYAVTPVASAGTTTGTEVFSAYSAVIAAVAAPSGLTAVNTWPHASNLTVTGNNLQSNGVNNTNGTGVSNRFIPSGGTGIVQAQYDHATYTKVGGMLRLGNNTTGQEWQYNFGLYKLNTGVISVRVGNEYLSDNVAMTGMIYVRMRLDGTMCHFERSSDGVTWIEIINSSNGLTTARPQPASALYIKAGTDVFTTANQDFQPINNILSNFQ